MSHRASQKPRGTPSSVSQIMATLKTLTLMIDGHEIGTADIYIDRHGVPGAIIDKDGTALVPVTARLNGGTQNIPTPST